MRAAERPRTVAALYAWAEWCDQNPDIPYIPWHVLCRHEAWRAALDWCEQIYLGGEWIDALRGREAALALCFAAAMIESGDTSEGKR
mgnify:CR=1 FL=1